VGTSTTTDVAVIGAGAAGIAAARRLQELGLSCQVLEARNRPGGRAWTETATLGVALDRGCAWLHDAERNPLRACAEAAGLGWPTAVPIRGHRQGAFGSAAANAALEARVDEGLRALVERAGAEPDQPTASLLAGDPVHGAFLRYVVTAISGAEPETYSSGDAAEEDAFESNWLVTGGLGRLISEDLAADLPIQLGTTVQTVDFRRRAIRLDTSAGWMRTDAVIVTAPVGVLADGRPGFRPALPSWKTDAFEAVAMGRAEKVALRFRGRPFGDDLPHFLTIERPTGLLGFHIEPGPPAVAIAYAGGELAAAIADMGEDEAVAMAMDYLAHAYGDALRDQLAASTATAWARDAWALGSYSAAHPGAHGRRRALAAPVADRVRFAGEATLPDAFATAHGAWLSGRREAEAVAAVLGAATLPTPFASG